ASAAGSAPRPARGRAGRPWSDAGWTGQRPCGPHSFVTPTTVGWGLLSTTSHAAQPGVGVLRRRLATLALLEVRLPAGVGLEVLEELVGVRFELFACLADEPLGLPGREPLRLRDLEAKRLELGLG